MGKRLVSSLLAFAMSASCMSAALAETTVTGTAKGFGGDVTVEATLDDAGKITALTIGADSETPAVGGAAAEKLAAAILEKGSADVETVSGATITSNAVLDALNAALNPDASADVKQQYKPGTYTGVAVGRGGDITVDVTVSEDAITAVEIKDASSETIGISVMPLEVIPEEIVAYQSLGVDTIAGATATSYGVLNAVANALEQAGANVAALRNVAVPKETPEAKDMSTQIVIAGAGMAGLVAAVTAADKGADVILVEKMPFVGGNLMIAGGGLGTVGAETVDEDDSLDRVLDYFKMVNETSERQPDYDFIAYLLPETGKTIDYLDHTFGLAHTSTDRGDYVRTNFGQGADLTASLKRILDEKQVTILLNTRAEHVVMKDGKATGLEVSNDGGTFTISADKVIIATGGASHDWDRMVEKNPELNTIKFFEEAAVSSTGDGFAMLEEIGAQMGDGPYIKSAYPDIAPAFRYTFRNSPSVANTLVVNAEGQRVNNEAPYNQMYFNKQLLRQASPAYYAIFDEQKTADYFLEALKKFAPDEDNTVAVYADTLEELAVKMDVDPQTLRASFDRYQSFCESGVDEDFGKDASHLLPYSEENGLYAVRVYAASWGTIGGAVVDHQFHAQNAQNETIENVFAIGECATSMLFGDYYFGGFSLGFYAAAGRVAAEAAVAELN